MKISLVIISVLLAYMAGSIPTSVWTGKIFFGKDIRQHGSGNAGATNTIRVFGWWTGIPVLLIDIAKGWLASSLPVFLHVVPDTAPEMMTLKIICGMAAIVGHVFPLFARFRGGKGVATTFGVLLALHPLLTLACTGIFLTVLFISGYVSLSSMIAGVMFPLLLFTVFHTPSLLLKVFSLLIAVALLLTHAKNIRRLIRGEEKKLLYKKTKAS